MNEKTFIALTPELFRSLQGSSEVFSEFLMGNVLELKSMLDGHWFLKKGSVIDPEVVSDSIRWTDNVTGTFKTEYRVSFFFACDGITQEKKENMMFDFRVDADYTGITLQLDTRYERVDEL
jgi:hypothetical protein